jgi:hypothetical protein
MSFLELVAHVKWFSRVSALLRKNARRSVEMIEKYYAAHLKTQLDATAINIMRAKPKKKPIPKRRYPRCSG